MEIFLKDDEIAYLFGQKGTLALAKTLANYFFIETDREEILLFTEEDDLIVASAFDIGDRIKRGLKCTIFQIRELGSPLIVLPKGHPASSRINIVVSIGSRTKLSCNIQPGTHPEQEILCGSEEFNGLELLASPSGAIASNFQGNTIIEKL